MRWSADESAVFGVLFLWPVLERRITRDDALHHGNILKRPGSSGDGQASRDADPEFDIFYDAGTLVVIAAQVTNEFVTADYILPFSDASVDEVRKLLADGTISGDSIGLP